MAASRLWLWFRSHIARGVGVGWVAEESDGLVGGGPTFLCDGVGVGTIPV